MQSDIDSPYQIEEAISLRYRDVIERSSSTIGGLVTQKKSLDHGERIVDIADKPPVDFFGRPIIRPPQDTNKYSELKSKKFRTELPNAMVSFLVNYRYHEGNSSAVRKPASMASFL